MALDTSDKIPTDEEIRTAVVAGLMVHEHQSFSGYHGLEDLPTREALAKITLGNIFEMVGILATNAGRPGDYSTIRGVVVDGLGIKDPDEAHRLAHEIGCNCQDEPLTGGRAARAIREYL